MPSKKETKVKSEKSKVETSRLASARSKSKETLFSSNKTSDAVIVRAKPALPRGRSRTTKSSFSVPVYSLASARESGKMELPKEYFGAKVNKALLRQALRVYLSNQKSHWASTKTRGEVEGSTRKIYKQKGTGRARHGGIRAPIFVGGGIALGPKPRKVTLDLPKKMKKMSLISALSEKASSGEVVGLTGAEKSTGKTKEIAQLLKKMNTKSVLIVVDKRSENLERAAKNIKHANVQLVKNINTYEVIRYKILILTKEAVAALASKGEGKESI